MTPTNKEIRIVQFVHPGPEHRPSRKIQKAGVYPWNYLGHRRKYMKALGAYVDDDGAIKEDTVYFWGEWEPWSNVNAILPENHIGDFPWFLHEPFFYSSPQAYPPYSVLGKDPRRYHRQNTDPFVFGDHFIYSLCKQDHYNVLRTLAPGSIILFGSPRNIKTCDPYFALDTVLVVGNSIEYVPEMPESSIGSAMPAHYNKIMGFKDWHDSKSKFFYQGVNFDEKSAYGGMFSFVPCSIGNHGKQGFERIKLCALDLDFISSNLSQGIKSTVSTLEQNIAAWQKICSIVKVQGCMKGVHFDYCCL